MRLVALCEELQSNRNSRFSSKVHQTHQQLKGQFSFHELIHFSSHTLTFIPGTLLMSAVGKADEVRDWQGIK